MSYTALVTCTCRSTLSDSAESLRLIIFVVFLFLVMKNNEGYLYFTCRLRKAHTSFQTGTRCLENWY